MCNTHCVCQVGGRHYDAKDNAIKGPEAERVVVSPLWFPPLWCPLVVGDRINTNTSAATGWIHKWALGGWTRNIDVYKTFVQDFRFQNTHNNFSFWLLSQWKADHFNSFFHRFFMSMSSVPLVWLCIQLLLLRVLLLVILVHLLKLIFFQKVEPSCDQTWKGSFLIVPG